MLQNQKLRACHYQVRYLEPYYGQGNFIKERVESQSAMKIFQQRRILCQHIIQISPQEAYKNCHTVELSMV